MLEVTAPPELLAARLAVRGREGPAEIAARLARQVPLAGGLRVARVVNGGTPEEGAAAVLAALEGAAREARPARLTR